MQAEDKVAPVHLRNSILNYSETPLIAPSHRDIQLIASPLTDTILITFLLLIPLSGYYRQKERIHHKMVGALFSVCANVQMCKVQILFANHERGDYSIVYTIIIYILIYYI